MIFPFNAELPQPIAPKSTSAQWGLSLMRAIAGGGIAVTLMAAPAFAHGAQISYQVVKTAAGPTVQVSALYDTEQPMAAAQVSIYRPSNLKTPWLTGTTDAQGRFEFTPDQGGNWDIKVRQAGHGALVTLPWSIASAASLEEMESAIILTGSPLGEVSQGRPLPPWLGLGLGVVGCLGVGGLLMRRSPQSKGVEL